MKRFTSILISLLCLGYAQAQVVQWLVPPEYDYIAMPSSDEGNLIVAQQGFNHHLWTMDGKCVAKVSDDLFPYSEGYAVATEPETANLTAIYDARGNKTSVADYNLQLGWGYTSFQDGFLLVHDGNYFYYRPEYAAATADEYPLFVSSCDPDPRDLLHTTCTPAESMLATAPMISSSGLAHP